MNHVGVCQFGFRSKERVRVEVAFLEVPAHSDTDGTRSV